MTGTSIEEATGRLATSAPPLLPRRKRGLTLRWRLIVLVIAGMLPLLVFSLIREYLGYRADAAIDRQRLLAVTRGLARALDGALEARVMALQTGATAVSLRNGDLDAFRAQASQVMALLFPGADLELVDATGRRLVDTRRPMNTATGRLAEAASLHRVLVTGRPAVSDVYQGPPGSGAAVSIDVPVRGADGRVPYVLRLHPRLGMFGDVIRHQHLAPAWVIAVLDRHGDLVARIPNDGKVVGQPVAGSLLGPLQTQNAGIVEATSSAGVPFLWAFSHGARFGWAVAIGAPRAVLTARAQTAALATLAVGSATLALALLLAIGAARRISGPIGTLRQLAPVAGRDAAVRPAPTGVPEVDDVAEAFFIAEDERQRSRRAEMLLRDGIDSIPEGFAIYDADDRLVMCNDTYRRLFAAPPGLVAPGARFDDLVRAGLADGRAAVPAGEEGEAWVAARVREHRDPDGAAEHALSDGSWVLVRNRRLSNGGVASLRIDITPLKRTQEALRTSEERFRRVVEAAPSAILTVDPDGRIDLANRQAEAMFGYARDHLIGRPVELLIPPGQRAHHPALRAEFAAEPKPRLMGNGRDLYAVRQDGTQFPVEVGLAPFTGDKGPCVLASIIDITARKEAERALRVAQQRSEAANAALRRSEERFRSIFDSVSEGIFIVSLTGRFTGINAAGGAMFGYTPDELIGADIETLSSGLPPYTQREALQWHQKAIATGQPQRFDWQCKAKDGRLFWAEVALLSAAIGGEDVVLAMVRDVTERRAVEDQLRQSQKMEAIGNLTGGMAHDFNNLLGIIVGNLDLARDRLGDDEDLREIITEALDAAWRGADLTRRLLAFARRQPLRPTRVNINELVSDTVRLLRRLLGEDIEVTLDLAADVWPVVVDPAQLEASLANLAANARDAMPKGGRLIVATANKQLDADYVATHPDATAGDFAMIEVSDTGCGMTPEVQRRIFEPFFTTKEVGRGTGLGLSMVFGFLRQSNGHVNVYSEPGIGTTFRLYLPRAAANGPVSREAVTAAPVPQGSGQIVLVVEDNVGVRRVVSRQLQELGYRVIDCDSSAAGLDILEAQPIDLLFTDIVMPGGLDGLELARLARERWPQLRVVLTSGFPQSRLDGALVEDMRLLSKPYRKEDLSAVLRAAFDA